jgi:hypothetical protein
MVSGWRPKWRLGTAALVASRCRAALGLVVMMPPPYSHAAPTPKEASSEVETLVRRDKQAGETPLGHLALGGIQLA